MENSLRSFDDLDLTSNQVKSTAPENELMEILWKNDPMHMVMQRGRNQKPAQCAVELNQTQIPNFVCSTIPQNSEQETDNFVQYSLSSAFEKDFCSELLSDFSSGTSKESNKNDTTVQFNDTSEICNAFTMSALNDFGNGKDINFPDFLKPERTCESSSLSTFVPSVCEANQCHISQGVKKCGKIISPRKKLRSNPLGATLTSSSGVSDCSLGPKSTRSNNVHKRKKSDEEELESYREEAGYESSEPDKISQRPTPTRKARAAEVHNLSERRRRDRINEKMKALQELLPHCNKTDKASMLDEAIEYLKSLQLQLQVMWMGNGMVPMMFPSAQQYMSRVGIGTSRASSLPCINNTIQSSRTPQVNNNMPASSYNFPTQIQNVQLPAESYVPYLRFPHMQLPNQGMNLHTYASQHMQNHTIACAVKSSLPTAGVSTQNIQNGR